VAQYQVQDPMAANAYMGWDLGGAHLKVAKVGRDGRLLEVRQIPCPLWQGLHVFDQALGSVVNEIHGDVHAVTMTGELADIFPDRCEGVRRLLERSMAVLGDVPLIVYAGKAGFVAAADSTRYCYEIASANWHASAHLAARYCDCGILVDIGSTTTDIVEFSRGNVCFRGYTDAERLGSEELVYTGVIRTPVFAVVSRVPFRGEWQSVTAERFATMADVYTLTGELHEPALGFLAPRETADGGGSDIKACARRLARMLGRDADAGEADKWRGLARYIAGVQRHGIRQALERMFSRRPATQALPLVGAGVGRFIVRDLALQLGHPYIDFSSLLPEAGDYAEGAALCAPAVAVAYLIQDHPWVRA
jgi:(4-(4-[2-(gamma-L-glutamylamino)ethyl]phenoxymethyl)furan-2-yl)methanamine synthase